MENILSDRQIQLLVGKLSADYFFALMCGYFEMNPDDVDNALGEMRVTLVETIIRAICILKEFKNMDVLRFKELINTAISSRVLGYNVMEALNRVAYEEEDPLPMYIITQFAVNVSKNDWERFSDIYLYEISDKLTYQQHDVQNPQFCTYAFKVLLEWRNKHEVNATVRRCKKNLERAMEDGLIKKPPIDILMENLEGSTRVMCHPTDETEKIHRQQSNPHPSRTASEHHPDIRRHNSCHPNIVPMENGRRECWSCGSSLSSSFGSGSPRSSRGSCSSSSGKDEVDNFINKPDVFPEAKQPLNCIADRQLDSSSNEHMCIITGRPREKKTLRKYVGVHKSEKIAHLDAQIDRKTSFCYDDNIFCYAGHTDHAISNRVNICNIATKAQTYTCTLPYPRHSMGMCLSRGCLYVIGGKEYINNEWRSSSSVISLDIHDQRACWVDLPCLKQQVDMPIVLATSQSVYVVGGSTNDVHTTKNQVFDRESSMWSFKKELPEACSSVAHGGMLIDGIPTVFGKEYRAEYIENTNWWKKRSHGISAVYSICATYCNNVEHVVVKPSSTTSCLHKWIANKSTHSDNLRPDYKTQPCCNMIFTMKNNYDHIGSNESQDNVFVGERL